jgi:hypothetical protein
MSEFTRFTAKILEEIEKALIKLGNKENIDMSFFPYKITIFHLGGNLEDNLASLTYDSRQNTELLSYSQIERRKQKWKKKK